MVLLDEWHLELLVPRRLDTEIAERLSADVDAAVRQVADDLTARLRASYGLPTVDVRASQ